MPEFNINVGDESWFNSTEGNLWSDLVDDLPSALDDRLAQALYHEAYYDHDILTPERIGAREALEDFMWDEYGIDFEAEFDWDAWREFMGYE
jgi:hypothetical protein